MKSSFVSVAILVLVLNSVSYGQILTPSGQSPTTATSGTYGGSYYNFSSLTGCNLLISVWGFVGNPGRYNVPCDTDLLDLLSFCGGPREGAYLDKVKIVRRGGVDKQDEIAQVFEIDVEKYLDLTDMNTTAKELLLFPRDLIIIDGEFKDAVDYVLRIAQLVVAITSIVTATVAVINISKN
jgi:NADH:ubiquinone oxidoreductase subunit F (NADH-binding)